MSERDEMLALLREASEVLRGHWFGFNGEDEYNNDDVIDLNERIDALLARIDGTTPAGPPEGEPAV